MFLPSAPSKLDRPVPAAAPANHSESYQVAVAIDHETGEYVATVLPVEGRSFTATFPTRIEADAAAVLQIAQLKARDRAQFSVGPYFAACISGDILLTSFQNGFDPADPNVTLWAGPFLTLAAARRQLNVIPFTDTSWHYGLSTPDAAADAAISENLTLRAITEIVKQGQTASAAATSFLEKIKTAQLVTRCTLAILTGRTAPIPQGHGITLATWDCTPILGGTEAAWIELRFDPHAGTYHIGRASSNSLVGAHAQAYASLCLHEAVA